MVKIRHGLPILILVAVLLVSSVACSIGGLSFSGNTATLDIKLSEDQLTTLFERVLGQLGGVDLNMMQKLERIELHEGYVTVFGTYTPEGGSPINGNFDVSLGAENGVLQAQITRVDAPGKNITDAQIQQANETIARELTAVVTDTNGDVTFQRAEVHEDALYLTVSVKIGQTP